jgi:hypothetical protein
MEIADKRWTPVFNSSTSTKDYLIACLLDKLAPCPYTERDNQEARGAVYRLRGKPRFSTREPDPDHTGGGMQNQILLRPEEFFY